MTKQDLATRGRTHATLTRVAAFLLLVFLAYGATVEVVHKHGNLVTKLDETTSSFKAANGDGRAAGESRQNGACLICQLHQNLSASLFNAQLRIAPPLAHIAHAATQPTSYLSQMDTPRRGRAPPIASLL